jgi:hypothetical protein
MIERPGQECRFTAEATLPSPLLTRMVKMPSRDAGAGDVERGGSGASLNAGHPEARSPRMAGCDIIRLSPSERRVSCQNQS